MLAHCCHGTHFPQQVQLLLSSLFHFFIGIAKDCQDFRLPGIVVQKGFISSALVSSLRSVFTVCIRCESTLSIGMSTSSFFVSCFPVSLCLTGSSSNVAVCVSVPVHGSGLLCFCALLASAWSSKLRVSSLCLVDPLASLRLPLSSPWVPRSRSRTLLVLQVEEQEVRCRWDVQYRRL